MNNQIIVMKFGGSSMNTAASILQVSDIIKSYGSSSIVIVVSAIRGVTDRLIRIFDLYKSGSRHLAAADLLSVYTRHTDLVYSLFSSSKNYKKVLDQLEKVYATLVLYLLSLKKFSGEEFDFVSSYGERLSSYLLCETLKHQGIKADCVDSGSVIVSANTWSSAKALLDPTRENVRTVLVPMIESGIIPVISGYYGATMEGKVVTFGRGGSDYSATVLANVLAAKQVILWKEVDGIFSEDPKKKTVSKQFYYLTFDEAHKLAKNGVKILHPEAIEPVKEAGIEVLIKNTFFPDRPGTLIR